MDDWPAAGGGAPDGRIEALMDAVEFSRDAAKNALALTTAYLDGDIALADELIAEFAVDDPGETIRALSFFLARLAAHMSIDLVREELDKESTEELSLDDRKMGALAVISAFAYLYTEGVEAPPPG